MITIDATDRNRITWYGTSAIILLLDATNKSINANSPTCAMHKPYPTAERFLNPHIFNAPAAAIVFNRITAIKLPKQSRGCVWRMWKSINIPREMKNMAENDSLNGSNRASI